MIVYANPVESRSGTVKMSLGNSSTGYDRAVLTVSNGRYHIEPGSIEGRSSRVLKAVAALNRGEESYVTQSGDEFPIRLTNPVSTRPRGAAHSGGPMKGHRTAAQKAATRKLVAWVRAHKGGTKKNPVHKYASGKSHVTKGKGRYKHNPSSTAVFGNKDVLSSLFSMKGLVLVGGGVAGLLLPEMAFTVLPDAVVPNNPWGRMGIKAGIGLGGAFLLGWKVDKTLGLGFGIGVLIGAADDVIRQMKVTIAVPAASQDSALAKTLAQNPALLEAASKGAKTLTGYGMTQARSLSGYGVTRAMPTLGDRISVRSLPAARYVN